ncbi:MAG: Asp-tRNA(Asn)/Glu-tRNA(Gln) amidotransferase subunit GatA [Ruminococcaceae bacterium]|nr:Asp-tRNA(Asn)/Glu-tRNA(Gln) amidotransferase subunit GatA [Oscillospiraceae bacterium]
MMKELMTITDCRKALCKREISARELTELYLQQIDARDREIGAYLTVCAEKAIQKAKEADSIFTRSADVVSLERNSNTLCGIPYACKDNIVTKGVRTTCASRILQDFVSPYDAAVVERLQSSGAVMLGKTNMDEFAMGSACEHSALGRTVHPLDPARSPGGSSGGSAAAVAAGEAVFALGSDTGGSARQPASFCGLVAMKPTYGLVPRYGLVEFASSMDTICPMTRTVEDNRMVLAALAGADPRDMTSVTPPNEWFEGIKRQSLVPDLKGKRIAMAADISRFCDAATLANTLRAARMLEELGCIVEETELPSPDHALETYVILTAAESSSNLARYDGIRYGTGANGESYREIAGCARTTGFGEEVTRRILTGAYALSAAHGGKYFHKIKNVQRNILHQMDAVMERYDAILMPTTGSVAFPLADGEKTENRYDSDRFTVYANLTGLPALQIPSGGDGKLPTGVSLLGRRFGEVELYRIAQRLEEMLAEKIAEEVTEYGGV